ncbi:AbiTii domain-containing protein [Blastomonas sp. SL216]|uniref:AbiTii domain-containing protein n=1 Tax=Blastomonas sp. SL216 TaxID=2995169 RepID=UPI00237784B0|nr:hypothetical protein OU999_08445 [Blastomonas sp. SL216]
MAGLVENIQAQALDANVKVSDLLRRVKVAAVKLKLDDASEWVDRELKGYAQNDIVPAYRQTIGQLKAHSRFHGIIPVSGDAEWVRNICKNPVLESIAKVEALAGDGSEELVAKVHGSIESAMNKAHGTPGTEYYIHSSQAIFLDVLDQVRTLVLDWSIELERAGILGEGIDFSVEEKNIAVKVASTIHIENFTGHLHQGEVSGDQNRSIVASNDQSMNTIALPLLLKQIIEAVQVGVCNEIERNALLATIRRLSGGS